MDKRLEARLDGLRHGDTDHDHEDVLVELVGGSAAMVPRSARRLGRETKIDLAELQRVVGWINTLVDQLPEMVEGLREDGVSWSVIGWAVGTTGEAARQRWGAIEPD